MASFYEGHHPGRGSKRTGCITIKAVIEYDELIGGYVLIPEIIHQRKEYEKAGLNEADLHADPVQQFRHWLDEALIAKLLEPYAMTLATVTPEGRPTARIVLLRGVDHFGFQFFTNYLSCKGQDIEKNAQGALLFYWAELERQVRIGGNITMTDDAASDHYFLLRPRASQIAAVASAQSQVIASRTVLEKRVAELTAELEGKPVPRPQHWGGYTLKPDSFEFWQGRPSRLHDRLRYRLENHRWIIERLSP
jgi:pyridoxamine 5'-phosphate oxidase